jgi:hypothetical protein
MKKQLITLTLAALTLGSVIKNWSGSASNQPDNIEPIDLKEILTKSRASPLNDFSHSIKYDKISTEGLGYEGGVGNTAHGSSFRKDSLDLHNTVTIPFKFKSEDRLLLSELLETSKGKDFVVLEFEDKTGGLFIPTKNLKILNETYTAMLASAGIDSGELLINSEGEGVRNAAYHGLSADGKSITTSITVSELSSNIQRVTQTLAHEVGHYLAEKAGMGATYQQDSIANHEMELAADSFGLMLTRDYIQGISSWQWNEHQSSHTHPDDNTRKNLAIRMAARDTFPGANLGFSDKALVSRLDSSSLALYHSIRVPTTLNPSTKPNKER